MLKHIQALGAPGVEINIDAHKPHDKLRPRTRAHLEITQNGWNDSEHTFMSRPIQLNLKTGEFAKPDKFGRITCDLTTPASLRGGWLVGVMKECWSQLMGDDLVFGRGKVKFVKSPNFETLSCAFNDLIIGDCFYFHSDDSCLSLKCSDGVLRMNMDIAQCDSTQGPMVFQTFCEMVPSIYLTTAFDLLRQCMCVAQLGYGHTKMLFQPYWYFEYSGTTLTTLLNNIANFCIGVQLMDISFGSIAQTTLKIKEILDVCGWSVTFDVCTHIEEIQFLKCSPFLVASGLYSPFLNFGVILRVLGQKYGDLDGSGDIEIRGYNHNSGVVRGLIHAGRSSLMDLLERMFCADVKAVDINATKFLGDLRMEYAIEDSIVRRYGITVGMYHELLTLIASSGHGDLIHCRASDMILHKDYGFPLCT